MATRTTLLAALCALVVASGCGDDDGPPSSEQKPAAAAEVEITAPDETAPSPAPGDAPASEDKRGLALACLVDEQGIDARPEGDKGIAIGDGDAQIDFYQSSLEAEGEQFEGRAEGAEQVGAALFYLRELDEQTIVAIEDCLNEQ